MKKEHTYIKCQSCEWQLENFTDRDWEQNPCHKCKNTRLVIDPREILCNLCGECMCPIGTHNEQIPHGLFEGKVTGGYDSYHLLDLNTYIFSFCEKCLRTLFNQCKIKPLVYDTDLTTGETAREFSWESDQSSYEERLWQDSDAPHQAYLNKKCNQRKDCPHEAVYSIFYDWEDQGGLKFTEKTACEDHKPSWPHSEAIAKPYVPPKLKIFL